MTNPHLIAALLRRALITEFRDYAVHGPTIKSFGPVSVDVERVAARIAAGLDDEPSASLKTMLEESVRAIEEDAR